VLHVSATAAAALGRHVLLALPRTAGQPGGVVVARLLLHAAGGLARPGERLLAGDALLRRLAARGLGQVRRRPWRGAGRPCGSYVRACAVCGSSMVLRTLPLRLLPPPMLTEPGGCEGSMARRMHCAGSIACA